MALKGLRGVFTGLHWASICLFALSTVLTTANTIARYVFNYVIFGSEEACTYSILLLAFLVFPVLEAKNNHLRIDIFDHTVKSSKVKETVYFIRGLFTMGVCGTMAYYGWRVTSVAYKYKSASNVLKIPKEILFGITTLCFVVTFLSWVCIILFNKRRPI